MDPLTALGLAANILQFVDFAGKLFELSKEIQRIGESSHNISVGMIANDLNSLSQTLLNDIGPWKGTNLGEDEKALRELASECIEIADKLSRELGKLKLDPRRPSKWRTFRHVLSTIWKEDAINAMTTRLERLRSALAFRLTVITKKNVDFVKVSQDERFSKLDQSTAKIIQQLHEAPLDLISSLQSQTLQIGQRHDQSDRLAIALQQETLAAIQKLYAFTPFPSKLQSEQRQIPLKEPLSLEEASTQILDMLKFRQMYAREESVEAAFPETFRWILSNQDSGSFSPLGPWIREGSGCYWLNGKAGSGKSTLMKFLSTSSEVGQLIRQWAGSNQLTTASFYFWRNGTPMQRSQEGLLRWLLYTILTQKRDLIEKCFPETIQQLRDTDPAKHSQNSDAEEDEDAWKDYQAEFDERRLDPKETPFCDLVKQAYIRLSEESLSSFRIFLFIDGVDEFSGNHAEISQFFRNISRSPNFKIVLSSRPIRACVEAFKHCPNLRLQDLTRKDLKSYLDAKIGSHPSMQLLLLENPIETSELLNTILSKASGVFLWVKLVVTSLLDGFRNYDRISDLKQRIDEFPNELSELYMHMFNAMEERYQRHAAQLIRMAVRGIEVQHNGALTILQLSFADESNPSKAITAPVGPISSAELQARSEMMEGRLQSRCCGLIEVVNTGTQTVIQVLHKSVLDFLAQEDMAGVLMSRTPKFNPDNVLSMATLLTIKKSPQFPESLDDNETIMDFLAYLQATEKSTCRAQIVPLYELIRVIQAQLDKEAPSRRPPSLRLPPGLDWQKIDLDVHEQRIIARRVALSSMIITAGLSRSIDHIFDRSQAQGYLYQDFDCSTLFKRTIGKLGSCYRLQPPICPLVEEYTDTLKTLVNHLKSTVDGSCSMGEMWNATIQEIEMITDKSSDTGESKDQIKLLKAFLDIVETLLHRNRGLYGFPLKYSFGPTVYGIKSDEWSAEILLRWLKMEARKLNRQNPEDDDILSDIEMLQAVINSLAKTITRRTASQEWSKFLKRTAIVNTSARSTSSVPAPLALRVHPGGPFELLADLTVRIQPGGPFELSANSKIPIQARSHHSSSYTESRLNELNSTAIEVRRISSSQEPATYESLSMSQANLAPPPPRQRPLSSNSSRPSSAQSLQHQRNKSPSFRHKLRKMFSK